jgi:MraZ protein
VEDRGALYVGTFEQLIDAKGRIILPGTFKQALGSSFLISLGFDRCLCLWKREDWEGFVARELEKRSEFSSEARRLSRHFHANTEPTELDSQNRFTIPQKLRNHERFDLAREIVLIGAGNRVEIWSRAAWKEYNEKTSGALEEIAESLARDLRI